jgi:hypothetical protein
MTDPNIDCLKLCFRGVKSSAPFKRCSFVDPHSVSKRYKNESSNLHIFHNDSEAKNIDFMHFSEPFTYNDITSVLPNVVVNGIMVFDKISYHVRQFISDYKDYVQIVHMSKTLVLQVIKQFSLKFHVYALNWNESRLLPHFFDYYNEADKIFIIDNGSDDNSKELTLKYKRDWMNFNTDNTLNDTFNGFIKLHIWKNSKNLCDFVIVQDLDEFLFFPDYPGKLKLGLAKLKEMGVTIMNTYGYNMGCTDEYFSNILSGQYLSSTIFNGVFSEDYCKKICFDPNLITEINYTGGAHTAAPEGKVVYQPDDFKVMMLHFKSVGLEYLKARSIAIRERVSAQNKKIGYGIQYYTPTDDIITSVTRNYTESLNNDIFHIMYPTYKVVDFNNRKCVVNLTDEKSLPFIEEFIKSAEEKVFVDLFGGYYSVIAKLSGYKKVYTTASDLSNTIFINNFDNFEIIDDDSILSKEVGVLLFTNNLEFRLTMGISTVIISLTDKLEKILDKFKDFSTIAILSDQSFRIITKDDIFQESFKEDTFLVFKR